MLNSSPRLTPFSLCFFNQGRVVKLKNIVSAPQILEQNRRPSRAPFVQPRLRDRHFMDSLHNANSILTDTWILYKHTQRYRRHLHDYASSDSSVSPRDVSPRDISTSVSGEESITLALASLDYLSSRDISTSVSGEESITLGRSAWTTHFKRCLTKDISTSVSWEESITLARASHGLPILQEISLHQSQEKNL